MYVAKPVTIEIVASGVGPAEISLHTAGTTTAEYVGDAGFAFKVLQEGDGADNMDAPLNNFTSAAANNINLMSKPSNLNGHLPQQQQPVTKTSHNKNFFFSRKNESNQQRQEHKELDKNSAGVRMTFLQSLDAKLQRLHDYAGRHRRSRRAAPADPDKAPEGGGKQDHVVHHKRPFMTVVRQGTFLKPPPELAALLGLSLSHGSSDSSLHQPSSSLNSSMLYSFSSQPRVLQHQHRHHCDAAAAVRAAQVQDSRAPRTRRDVAQDSADNGSLHSNLMYDRRVVRGNTFAHNPLPANDAQEATAAALRQAEARRRALARRRARGSGAARYATGATTPPPVHGRQHLDVQTDRFLEEIFDKPVEAEACCQTDLFLERPSTPQFVPASSGRDAETQILPGELFDFEEEVSPLLEVLVGRTVEQALVEVLEEEELAATERQRARLAEVRAAQQEEQARLEEQEARLRLEKERRVAEHAMALRALRDTEERVAAVAVSRGYLEELLPSVLDSLQKQHAVADETQQVVSEEFMPWLMAEVQDEVQKLVTSKEVISDIVREVLETRAELRQALGTHGDVRPEDSPAASSESSSKVGEAGDADAAAVRPQSDTPV